MTKQRKLISRILYNKLFLQLILATFMIGIAIFFISHEHLEVVKIREQLVRCDPWWVVSGIVLTVVYLLFQGLMYVHSFKSIGKKISIKSGVRLYLKRNLVSIFLPAGGFSSLLFFSNEVEKEGATKSQIHLASTIFGFLSMMSVVVVAIPILGFALFNHHVGQTEILGFVGMLVLLLSLILLFVSLLKKGRAYRFLARLVPSWALILDEMSAVKIRGKEVVNVLLFSVGIEVIGILHLYISMMALGVEPSILASMIGYITMVILLMASPFLRGLGAIEVSVTYILGQFGFPILTASTITLLYRFFEFWLPMLIGLITFITKKDNLILKVFPACLLFLLGLVNIIYAITPQLPAGLSQMVGYLPDYLESASNGLVLFIGLIMIILCVFLFQGSRRAWFFSIFLTLVSGVAYLLKGANYEQAIFSFVTTVSLFYTRDLYRVKSHPKFIRVSNVVLMTSIVAFYVLGVIGFYNMNPRHFGLDFDLQSSIRTTFNLFFLFDSGSLVPATIFARNFIYIFNLCSAVVLFFIFFNILKPYVTKPYNSPEDRDLARRIVRKYGCSNLDYLKTYPDKFYFFAPDKDGFISFKVTRNFAFVLENPVCQDELAAMDLIRRFDLFCQENGFVSVYYRVPAQALDMYLDMGKRALPIGDEAVVDLSDFSIDRLHARNTKEAIARLESEGYVAKVYAAPISETILHQMEQVSASWLKNQNRKEISFSEGAFDKKILTDQTIVAVADPEGKLCAFLNVVPDFNAGEATYDLIRKKAEAPKEVTDLLLVCTLNYFKEQGFTSANLGMAPLSAAEGAGITRKALRFAYENLKTFSHFKHLRRFKGNYVTTWQQKYLIYNLNYHLPQIPRALKRVSEGR